MDPQASDLRLAGVYTLKLESRSGARAKLVSAWVSVRTSSLIPLLATDAISGGGGTVPPSTKCFRSYAAYCWYICTDKCWHSYSNYCWHNCAE